MPWTSKEGVIFTEWCTEPDKNVLTFPNFLMNQLLFNGTKITTRSMTDWSLNRVAENVGRVLLQVMCRPDTCHFCCFIPVAVVVSFTEIVSCSLVEVSTTRTSCDTQRVLSRGLLHFSHYALSFPTNLSFSSHINSALCWTDDQRLIFILLSGCCSFWPSSTVPLWIWKKEKSRKFCFIDAKLVPQHSDYLPVFRSVVLWIFIDFIHT